MGENDQALGSSNDHILNSDHSEEVTQRRWKLKQARLMVFFCILGVSILLLELLSMKPFVSTSNTTGSGSSISNSSAQKNKSSKKQGGNYAPVIINAGHGTTGTHEFFYATCRLGYPSFHYSMACIPKNTLKEEVTNRQSREVEFKSEIFESDTWRELVDVHTNYIGRYLRDIRLSKRLSKQARPFKDVITTNVEALIVKAKEMNITLALHDTPFPMSLSYVIKTVKKHHDNKPPLIILSERSSMDWIDKRIKNHGKDLVCKDIKNNNSTINPYTLKGGLFDILSCIERGLKSFNFNDTKFPKLSEFVENIEEFVKSGAGDGEMNEEKKIMEMVAKQMDDYLEAVRNLSIFSYNMFVQPNRTETRDLADKIMRRMHAVNFRYSGLSNLYRVNFQRLWKKE